MFEDSTQIYNSDRISRAADMGMPASTHGISTSGSYLGKAFEEYGPRGNQRLVCMRKSWYKEIL
jgi:hypothetical protein